jgi:hypothetical protein
LKIIIILISVLIFLEFFLYLFSFKLSKIKWIVSDKKILSLFNKKKFFKFLKLNYDKNLGWDLKPYSKKNGNKYTETYFIDSLGRRNSVNKNLKQTVSTFGDSYVFCRQVSDNDTWQEYISKRNKSLVSNYGVGNYGLDQAYIKFKKKKLPLSNNIIIFGFVPETICRIQSKWKHFIEFGNIHGFKPSVTLKKKKIIFEKNYLNQKIKFEDLNKIIKVLKKKDRFYKEKYLKLSFKFPYLVSFIKNFNINIRIFYNYLKFGNNFIDKIENKVFPQVMKNNIKISHKLYNENYSQSLMTKLLFEIDKNVKRKKMKCLFIIFPQLFDLKLSSNKTYKSYFKTHHNKLNILDLTENFLNLKNYSKYFINDNYGGHLNKRGNKFVANIIYKKINIIKK